MNPETYGSYMQVAGILVALVATFVFFGPIWGVFALSVALILVGAALQAPRK